MNNKKSFTLIELLVVIVIIGILAGVIMISTSSSIDKAVSAKAKAFSSNMQNVMFSSAVGSWKFDELGQNIVINGDFENGFNSGVGNNWHGAGGGTFLQETSIIKTGSAQKIISTGNGQIYQNIVLTAGKTYNFSAWIYVVSTLSVDPKIHLYTYQSFYGNRNLVGQWQKIQGSYTPMTTQTYQLYVGMLNAGGTGTYIIDNVFVQELDIKDEVGSNNGIVSKYGTDSTYPEYYDKESNNCVSGGCFKFYGDDSGTIYNDINVPVTNSLRLKRSMTLSAWAKIIGNSISGFIGGSHYFLAMDSSRQLYFNIHNGTSWLGTTRSQILSENFIKNWHYYVATYDYDAGIVRLYIDGELRTQATGLKENNVGQIIANDPSYFHIGDIWNNWNTDGYIDEAGLYDKSLSQAEIKNNYASGLYSMLAQGTILKEEYVQRIENLGKN